MKVKVPNSRFTGISHRLKFTDGVSEECKNNELVARLLAKGYVEADYETSLSKMKVEELKVKAQELGIEIPEGAKADNIRALIKTKLEVDGQ